jgi:hypothetical protein
LEDTPNTEGKAVPGDDSAQYTPHEKVPVYEEFADRPVFGHIPLFLEEQNLFLVALQVSPIPDRHVLCYLAPMLDQIVRALMNIFCLVQEKDNYSEVLRRLTPLLMSFLLNYMTLKDEQQTEAIDEMIHSAANICIPNVSNEQITQIFQRFDATPTKGDSLRAKLAQNIHGSLFTRVN